MKTGQADGITRAIENLRESGTSYASQAILCRTHGQAEALAARLTARNIPTLYQGALLERPEVKDMLCLLSVLAGEDGSGLLRIAAWPEYGAAQADTLALVSRLETEKTEKTPLIQALQDSSLPDGLRHLGKHLAELASMEDDPALLLREYLFERSQYLRQLYNSSSPMFIQTQQALAIHQLLGLAETFEQRFVVPGGQTTEPPNKVKAFLTHVRRMAAAGETLRGATPPEAGALDAVRILTAHAAKGREYPVVFLPNLGAGQFPARGRHDGIPEPPGLADAAGQEADEEEFLFFVALSRARDHLILSHSESNAGRTREAFAAPGAASALVSGRGHRRNLLARGRGFRRSRRVSFAKPRHLANIYVVRAGALRALSSSVLLRARAEINGNRHTGRLPRFPCLRSPSIAVAGRRTSGRTNPGLGGAKTKTGRSLGGLWPGRTSA